MDSENLPKQIGLLVDHLRSDKNATMSMSDVASITEVLIATMRAFFRSVDTSVYRECRSLSDYISNARMEIASLQPVDLEGSHIPRAGLELDAIVQQTEEATNTIMTSAEIIMSADASDIDTYKATVDDAVMQIFEACSFQDITGQRISKVVNTLRHIEERVLELRNLMGVTEDDIADASDAQEKPEGDKALLSGPALDGEGIDQGEVDNLMDAAGPTHAAETDVAVEEEAAPVEVAPAPAPEPVPEPEPVSEPVPEPVPVVEKKAEKPKEAKKAPAPAAAPAPAPAPDAEVASSAAEEVSQEDIDALFN